jgi:hypothetical protein
MGETRLKNRAAHPWRHLFSTYSPTVDIHTLLHNVRYLCLLPL